MSDTIICKGRCLFGKVKVTANTMSQAIGACHCSMCRRWSGGPLMAVDCGNDVEFEGQENISVYNSSAWAERGFCLTCGSHLFYRMKQNNKHIIPVGIFENIDGLSFDHQVFIDEKPNYYCFSNQTNDMTGKEIFEKFSPG